MTDEREFIAKLFGKPDEEPAPEPAAEDPAPEPAAAPEPATDPATDHARLLAEYLGTSKPGTKVEVEIPLVDLSPREEDT